MAEEPGAAHETVEQSVGSSWPVSLLALVTQWRRRPALTVTRVTEAFPQTETTVRSLLQPPDPHRSIVGT